MKPRNFPAAFFCLLFGVAGATAGNQNPSPEPPHLAKQTRMDIIRAFTMDLVYIHTAFPMGKQGLAIKDGTVSPDAEQLQQLIAMWGPATKPGDQAMITRVMFKNDRIEFEINGGPVKKQKWYQHIQVGGGAGSVPIAPGDAGANARGSFVDLVFDHYIPELNPQQLKDLLRPVFDFNSKTAEQAYLETIPPKAAEAIKAHRVLVGMNREMVIYAKGRAPKKDREKDGDVEYEEWIYGDPPDDVDFVRFVGDEVIRVETMKVTGEKILRTEKEIDLEPTVAKKDQPEERPAGAPSLRRPGEAPDPSSPTPSNADPGVRPTAPPPPPGAPPPQSLARPYLSFRVSCDQPYPGRANQLS